MRKLKNILFAVLTALTAVGCILLVRGFDGVLARIGAWCALTSAAQYQNAAFILAVFAYLLCMALALLLPTALTKLQYKVTYPTALSFAVGRYGLGFITLPLFVMRFVSVNALIPYIINEEQIANPLYHETLWRECAEWGSMAMVLILIFWGCLMVMNLFGSLRYGYVAVNVASALCLIPMLYLSLDYAWVANGQNLLFTALVLLTLIAAVYGALKCRGQETPPLRPFFTHADSDDLFWRKKREKERKWHDHRDI